MAGVVGGGGTSGFLSNDVWSVASAACGFISLINSFRFLWLIIPLVWLVPPCEVSVAPSPLISSHLVWEG